MTHPYQERQPLVDPIYCHEHKQWECAYVYGVGVIPPVDLKCCHTSTAVVHSHGAQ